MTPRSQVVPSNALDSRLILSDNDIQRIAEAVALKMAFPPEIDLWDARMVANYLKVSERTVAENYSAHHRFPKPIDLSEGTNRTRRWKATEVVEWAESRR